MQLSKNSVRCLCNGGITGLLDLVTSRRYRQLTLKTYASNLQFPLILRRPIYCGRTVRSGIQNSASHQVITNSILLSVVIITYRILDRSVTEASSKYTDTIDMT